MPFPIRSSIMTSPILLPYISSGKSSQMINGCGICETYCPESVIAKNGDRYAPDLDYCKGCGICANVCPKGAITMILEGK